jgi:ankyrin repeat protein
MMAIPRDEFLKAALWHGPLDEAEHILSAHPDLAADDIHVAAVLGDDEAVRRCLERDPGSVHARSAPFGGDALNYLGLSRYLRLVPERTDAFLRAATALLDAGADPNTGFWTTGESPEHETALYGAAGVAHHGPLTRLLLERGADPNDPEVAYHSPEEYDLAAMQAVVETGRVTPENLALMLVRKHDWHDTNGVRYLLEFGVGPNAGREKGLVPLHHAIARDNEAAIIELLVDHGADFSVVDGKYGIPAVAHAARRGRIDILELLDRRGIDTTLEGVDRLIAACARRDAQAAWEIADTEPGLASAVRAMGGKLLAEFAGNDNTGGVACLLDNGIGPDARFVEGDGYWNVAANSTALHVAAWRCSHDSVRLLIERGADVNAKDAQGRTPLVMAIRACVDSYWTEWRSTKSIAPLLEAGASTEGVTIPTGYDEADALLRGGT